MEECFLLFYLLPVISLCIKERISRWTEQAGQDGSDDDAVAGGTNKKTVNNEMKIKMNNKINKAD